MAPGAQLFITNCASLLFDIPARTLAQLAAKGGVRVYKRELLRLATTGNVLVALGDTDPTHLTFRDLWLSGTEERGNT